MTSPHSMSLLPNLPLAAAPDIDRPPAGPGGAVTAEEPLSAFPLKQPTSQIIRALVVDDSAFVRKTVREMLSRSPYIEVVGTARDGEEALEMVQDLKPDVVTCDLIMPRLDGVGFVRKQMARQPIPILILTASP